MAEQCAPSAWTGYSLNVAHQTTTFLYTEPTSFAEVAQAVAARADVDEPAGVAVDAVVLDPRGRWLLHRRGPGCRDEVGMLEGLGGSLEPGEDPRAGLAREIREEAGEDLEVETTRFIAGRVVHPRSGSSDRPWVVISYFCQLRSGEPRVVEPEKNAGFVRVRPADVDPRELSPSAHAGWRWLRRHTAT